MARDILSEYGSDHTAPSHGTGSSGLTTGGGKPYKKAIDYHPPKGPTSMSEESPGLHGSVHPCGSQQGS